MIAQANCEARHSPIARLTAVVAATVAALLMTVPIHEGARAETASIKIAVEDAAAPWSFMDGTGYANDIVKAAFDAVHWHAVLQVVPYSRCKNMVLTGGIAACFTVGKSTEVAKVLSFPDHPLFIAQSQLYVLSTSKIDGCHPFMWPKRTRLGSVLGYEYPSGYKVIRDDPAVDVNEVSSEAKGLKMLVGERLDVLLLNLGEGKPLEYVMVDAGVRVALRKICDLGGIDSYIAFSPLNILGQHALDAFNRGYRIIRENGTAAAIADRWHKDAISRASILTTHSDWAAE